MEAMILELVATLGPPGLLALGVWLIMTGRLVPRKTYEDALHDRDEWRAESRIKDQEIQVKNEQLAHLAEVGKTQVAIMSALKQGPTALQNNQYNTSQTSLPQPSQTGGNG